MIDQDQQRDYAEEQYWGNFKLEDESFCEHGVPVDEDCDQCYEEEADERDG